MGYATAYLKAKAKRTAETPEAAGHAMSMADVLRMPLEKFIGDRMAVRCTGEDGDFWIVSDQMTAVARNVPPPYYTAKEIGMMLKLRDPDEVHRIHKAKMALHGEVLEVRP